MKIIVGDKVYDDVHIFIHEAEIKALRGLNIVENKEERRYDIVDVQSGIVVFSVDEDDSFEIVPFLLGKSNYFIARNVEGGIERAIFCRCGRQISDWYYWIDPDGLVTGKSDYYIAGNPEEDIESEYVPYRYAIFHKDGRQISGWHSCVCKEGLVNGESDYYVTRDGSTDTLYHKDGYIISSHVDISLSGDNIIHGKSNYYVAADVVDNDSVYAIYAVFGKESRRVTDWYEEIEFGSLLRDADSYYFAFKKKGQFYITKLGSEEKRIGPFKYMWVNSKTKTYEVKTKDGYQTITTKDLEQFFAEKYTER
ncbi:hypothetical protein [Caldisericum sp.]|uniref:hypothetical protein n=1 Tax=Caldisericum sp. TaxID=2499687 RepID=UPI003D0EF5C5